jgi:hypothetical protein
VRAKRARWGMKRVSSRMLVEKTRTASLSAK